MRCGGTRSELEQVDRWSCNPGPAGVYLCAVSSSHPPSWGPQHPSWHSVRMRDGLCACRAVLVHNKWFYGQWSSHRSLKSHQFTSQPAQLCARPCPDSCLALLTGQRALQLCTTHLFSPNQLTWDLSSPLPPSLDHSGGGTGPTGRSDLMPSDAEGRKVAYPPLGPLGRLGAAVSRAVRRTEGGRALEGSRLEGAWQCLGRSCSLLRSPPDQ